MGFAVGMEPDSDPDENAGGRLQFRAAGRAGTAHRGAYISDRPPRTFLEIEDEASDLPDFVASLVIDESATALPDEE